jgi:ABC-type glycerol-3-phosphate transport system substrate-binding protein
MYQIIEGGKGGMFRVGDWNVAKWDRQDVLNGDFVLGPWPQFKAGDKNVVVMSGMRGAAVPANAKNRDEAVRFLQFMLTKEAQQSSLKNIGSAVRGDLDLSALGDHGRFFASGTTPTVAYDFPESLFTYYSGIEEIYHKALLKALADRTINVDALLMQAEVDMKAYIASKK